MNELSELLFNPITIIASILAAFFVLMAFLRRRHPHHPDQVQREDAAGKPYHVADPYSIPPPRATLAPAPAPTLLAATPHAAAPAPRKVFRQFGQSALQPQADQIDAQTGYVWE